MVQPDDLSNSSDLVRRAWFDELAAETQLAFREYLIRKGLDPATITEEQAEAILQHE